MGYWEGIGPEDGKIIDDDVAFQYALERCTKGTEQEQQDFEEMLVEWYFSGNWIRRKYDHLQEEEREVIRDGEPLRD